MYISLLFCMKKSFSICDRQNNGNQGYSSHPKSVNILLHLAKRTLQMWLTLRNLRWIIQVGPIQSQEFLKVENISNWSERRDHRRMGFHGFEGEGREPQTREYEILPRGSRRRHSSGDTSEMPVRLRQNHEITNLCGLNRQVSIDK